MQPRQNENSLWDIICIINSIASSQICREITMGEDHQHIGICSLCYLTLISCFNHAASHYNDVIMGANASKITSLTIVYSTVCSGADQWKHQSSASLAFVRGIHRGPVNSPHKWPVTRKMFPFDDIIMSCCSTFWNKLYSQMNRACWYCHYDTYFG